MQRKRLLTPKALLLSSLAVILSLLLACGSAAEPVIIEKEVIVEKIVEKIVIKEIPKEITIDRIVIATPTPIPVAMQKDVKTKVDRVIYAFGEVVETNRHWATSRPSYYQFDPYAETLVGLNATTNERIPRLATSWEWTPNGKEWIFKLKKGVPFQFGFGEFTAKDVLHAMERQQWPDSQSGSAT